MVALLVLGLTFGCVIAVFILLFLLNAHYFVLEITRKLKKL